MRYFLFALMIALLPLRGWVGDVMATEMAVGQVQGLAADNDPGERVAKILATKPIANDALDAGVGNTFEDERASVQASVGAPDCFNHAEKNGAESADAGCANCAICQMCHTVGLTETSSATEPGALHESQPRASMSQFASAVTALGQKPPIS